MDAERSILTKTLRCLSLLIMVFSLQAPASAAPATQTSIEVVVDPQLNPVYSSCEATAWYPIISQGYTAYLTLNVLNPSESTNSGEWHPIIPQKGYYRVEAYIVNHGPITWCTSGKIKDHDTTEAHYTIHHAYGGTDRIVSQYPLSNQWVNLGEFYFNAGSAGYVRLTDLNSEAAYSTTVSFSAMRFTFTRSPGSRIYLPQIESSDPSRLPTPKTGIIQAQGFDACHLPSISEMQTWWDHSPYSFYALYMGGISLYSGCAVANADWINTVHLQGWSFVPVWVGLQAPCYGYKHPMSSDPIISYQQGRQEAQDASSAAASLGLTYDGSGGTVIYYDMEPFGGASPGCRQAAASFMNGWDERLRELGNISGGYGAHNSYVEDWALIENAPANVWAASWYADNYDPYASVNGISWLNGLWTNHQRIRQYAGDHSENWGGVGLGIDSNVADGMVAMPPSSSLSIPNVESIPPITDAGWLSAQQGWLVAASRLYRTDDRGISWVDVSPANVKLANFLPGGHAWALSSMDEEGISLYYSNDWGATWDRLDPKVSLVDGWPTQLNFTTPSLGWMVVQRMTSQVFSTARLLKTTDGGLTWQSYDLPTSGRVSFSSPTDGWLQNDTKDQTFNTNDGGLTWLPAASTESPRSISAYPNGMTLSGWQTVTTGWATSFSGDCTGDKSTAGFTCQVNRLLWQTLDGGQNWNSIPLPSNTPIKR